MKHYLYSLIAISVFAFASCKKDSGNTDNGTTTPGSATKISPDGFNFATAKNVNINLTLQAPNGEALPGVIVNFYNPSDSSSAESAIFKAVTDKSGKIAATISVPASLNSILIDPAYIGLIRYAKANINSSNAITAVLGGKEGFSGDIATPVLKFTNAVNSPSSSNKRTNELSGPTNFVYPSPYTGSGDAILNTTANPLAAGRPVYISPTPDAIDASILAFVNATYPNRNGALQTTHPQYFAANVVNILNVTSAGNVSVTWMQGYAGANNTLAYYTYPTNNPPTSLSAITKATYVFPNGSNNSGSASLLQPGDKVNLGTFSAGTTIAFILIKYGWNTNGYVDLNQQKWYATSSLNTDKNSHNAGKHTVVTYDNVHNVFIMGFEDTDLGVFACDFDYNDMVVYASASNGATISTTNVPVVDKGADTDGDGVPNSLDAFPNDASRAYISYFPSQTGYAQLAFEDNWPNKGDYDMNDLILNYRYTFTVNAQNQAVDMTGEFNCAAVGASFRNGFGVSLPISNLSVSSVTGQNLTSNYITLNSNGTEAGQTRAVIIPFDNTDAVLKNPDGAFFVNTLLAKNKVTNGSTVTVKVTFTGPIGIGNLPISGFNPFLISNQKRGSEVHLPGYEGTDKATANLFNTSDDNSKVAKYTSKDNWPWAISYNGVFNYPIEGSAINLAYPRFLDWAASGGTTYTDWYTNTASGYRNSPYIYNK
jgi:LruC domain-containing protein